VAAGWNPHPFADEKNCYSYTGGQRLPHTARWEARLGRPEGQRDDPHGREFARTATRADLGESGEAERRQMIRLRIGPARGVR